MGCGTGMKRPECSVLSGSSDGWLRDARSSQDHSNVDSLFDFDFWLIYRG